MIDPSLADIVKALLTALPPTLLAYAALRQGRKNEAKADVLAVKTDDLADKADAIGKKADVAAVSATVAAEKAAETHFVTEAVARQTNGTLSKLNADLAHMTADHAAAMRLVQTLASLLTPAQVSAARVDPLLDRRTPKETVLTIDVAQRSVETQNRTP